MVTELRPQPSIYSVKFVNTEKKEVIEDFQATGTSDAQDKWEAKYPGCQLVTIWRAK